MSGHDDYAVEPVRGLPEMLPPGEEMLWQGAPSAWELAKHVFHIRAVAVYFAVLLIWRGSVHWSGAHPALAASFAALSLLPICMAGLGMLGLLAWLSARTSVYTITSKRIVLRIGVALPTAINIPFTVIDSAGVAVFRSGAADIPLRLSDGTRIPFATLWPHVRPWHLNKPQPMLRGVHDGARVADILSTALRADLASRAGNVTELFPRHGSSAAETVIRVQRAADSAA